MTVLLPRDLAEALDMRARHPEATPIAGGTDLCVHWPQRVADEPRPRTWLDLSSIDELRERRWTEDELVLGARATYWDVIQDRRAAEELPLLVDAALQVGAVQIQVLESGVLLPVGFRNDDRAGYSIYFVFRFFS